LNLRKRGPQREKTAQNLIYIFFGALNALACLSGTYRLIAVAIQAANLAAR
jgi:hypothetical protein